MGWNKNEWTGEMVTFTSGTTNLANVYQTTVNTTTSLRFLKNWWKPRVDLERHGLIARVGKRRVHIAKRHSRFVVKPA